MRAAWFIISALVAACGPSSKSYDQEIALMGETYTSEFQDGMIGCQWDQHGPFPLHPPLKGDLYFNDVDCGSLGKPAYGFDRRYVLTKDNRVMVEAVPTPQANHPHKLGGPTEVLSLHDLSVMTEQAFMEQFLSSDNPNCEIGKTASGFWTIGYSQSYLETQGYVYETYPGARPTEFPYDEKALGLCSKPLHDNWREGGLRVQKNIGFQYDQHVIERSKMLDPGSIVIRF